MSEAKETQKVRTSASNGLLAFDSHDEKGPAGGSVGGVTPSIYAFRRPRREYGYQTVWFRYQFRHLGRRRPPNFLVMVMVTVTMKDWRLLLEKVVVVVLFLVWAPVSLNTKEATR
jgi:hypothetical protein